MSIAAEKPHKPASLEDNAFDWADPLLLEQELSAEERMVRSALERLSGRISAADMRAMNYAADVEHRDIAAVARAFLAATR